MSPPAMLRFAWLSRALAIGVAVCTSACSLDGGDDPLDFPGGLDGKTDSLGRGLAGIADDYVPAMLDEGALVADMRERRQAAWASVEKVLAPVPLLGIPGKGEADLEGIEIPNVARWQTWYGIDDIKRMFQDLYSDLDPAERVVRADFSTGDIANAETDNAKAIERSTQWPLERYLRFVRSLGQCPSDISDDECARLVAQQTGGAVSGNARILYSPGVALHVLGNYRRTLQCLSELDQLSVSATPVSDENFTACFDREVPLSGVVIKAQWVRADFGRRVRVYDTDASALSRRLSGTATWGESGDRERDPSPDEIFTIRLRNGDTYRLVGLHIMTKELRHWQWISLWWSDTPEEDFGADRPSSITERLPPVWRNYKMCVVDGYVEGDADPASRFDKEPTLAAALAATTEGLGGPTWCSNPYMERGRNNARTNCIGCHQHGGATKAFGDQLDIESMLEDEARFPQATRARIRNVFAADYLFAFNRVDDFSHMIEGEVGFHDAADSGSVAARIAAVLRHSPDIDAGTALYSENCATCHGADGEGSGAAPSLAAQIPQRDDEFILRTIILGRGGMPSWGETFADQDLANLLGGLRSRFN